MANDVEQWVGSDGKQEIHELGKHMKTDHIVLTGHTSDGELTARVKLFKNSPTPEYIVIVGRMKEKVHALYQSLGHYSGPNTQCRVSDIVKYF